MIVSPLKVVIIFGGIDGEKNISLSTVRSFMEHGTYNKNVELFFMDHQLWFYKVPVSTIYGNHIEDFYGSLDQYGYFNLQELMDYLQSDPAIIVFNTVHGAIGEDGHLNRCLAARSIAFTGSTFNTMDSVFDKYKFNQLMETRGLKSLDYFLLPVNDLSCLLAIKDHMTKKKYILKPRRGGSSIGVQIIKEFSSLTIVIMTSWQKYGDMILEEYFEGVEFSVAVVDNLWPWQPTSKIIFTTTDNVYSYEKKYMINEGVKYGYHQCSEALEQSIKHHCHQIVKDLKCKSIVRIDGIVRGDEFIINDCNTNPAMDQNSLLFKTKLGSLREIFDHVVEENISLYFPHLIPHKAAYKQHFINQKAREVHKDTIKSFLRKMGIGEEYLWVVDSCQTKPMDVKIITGGNSNEKNVALLSGSNVYLQLSKSFLFNPSVFCWHHDEIYPMDYGDCGFTLVDNLIGHLANPMALDAWIKTLDTHEFIFLGVHGGHGENGTLQNLLAPLSYNGSDPELSQLFMDKYGTSLKFHGSNTYKRWVIDTVNKRYRCNSNDTFDDYMAGNNWIYYQDASLELQPLLGNDHWCWKPNNDGCSVGIKIIKKGQPLPWNLAGVFILEQFINGDSWVELTAGIMGQYCLNPSITLASGDFLTMEEKFQYGLGINLMASSQVTPSQMETIKKQLKNFMDKVHFNSYCRVDFFYNCHNDQVHIIEVNSLPALTPATVLYHQGAMEGLSQQQLLEAIIFHDYIAKKLIPITIDNKQ
jgi:D-alanine--D-alanine ligase